MHTDKTGNDNKSEDVHLISVFVRLVSLVRRLRALGGGAPALDVGLDVPSREADSTPAPAVCILALDDGECDDVVVSVPRETSGQRRNRQRRWQSARRALAKESGVSDAVAGARADSVAPTCVVWCVAVPAASAAMPPVCATESGGPLSLIHISEPTRPY